MKDVSGARGVYGFDRESWDLDDLPFPHHRRSFTAPCCGHKAVGQVSQLQ